MVMLPLLLLLTRVGVAHQLKPPLYAKVLGVTLGIDSIQALEAHIGDGKIQPGGHSNSGRLWKFKCCTLSSDAFERSGTTLLLDYFCVQSWKGRLGDCYPFRCYKSSPLGALLFGENLTDCVHQLQRAGLHPTLAANRIKCQNRSEAVIGREKRKLTYTLTISGARGIDTIVVTIDYS
jgi:hypothetical protein